MSKTTYIEALKDGISKLRAAGREVTLVHHNDADGLTAGAILESAFPALGSRWNGSRSNGSIPRSSGGFTIVPPDTQWCTPTSPSRRSGHLRA